jgi:hypothetical protein
MVGESLIEISLIDGIVNRGTTVCGIRLSFVRGSFLPDFAALTCILGVLYVCNSRRLMTVNRFRLSFVLL